MSFMLVTMVFQTLYFLVDLYWVGRLGKEAVAAVGVAGNLTFLVLAVTQMLAVGTTTLIAHASGRKEQDHAISIFNQALVLGAVAGLAFLIMGLATRTWYSRTMSADAITAQLAGDYLLWFMPAMALQYPMVAMTAALRGTGNFKPGMIVQTTTVIVNLVLAPFLIFGWGTGIAFGVAGAAVASLIAVAFGTAWISSYFLADSTYLHFRRREWKPKFDLWGRMLKIGLPAGAEFVMMAVYLFIVYSITRPFGAAAQAGFGIGMRVVQAFFLPVVALGFAVAPVAGQNFGAHKADRVRKTFSSGAWMAASYMLAASLACNIAPASMMRVFSDDPNVIAIGVVYLRIISWNFIASGVVFVASSMFQAMGNTLPALASSFIRLLAVAIPLMVLTRMDGFALSWIWYLSVAATLLQLAISLLLLQREYRVRLSWEGATVPVRA
jgi:putative MATE family efflux protein